MQFLLHPQGSKRTHQVADIMGLSHQQLRTVAEIYNPNCFGPLTKKSGLIAGKAFDSTLGDNTLETVRSYVRQVRPGLVAISPPCKIYSQLHNLSKHKCETVPDHESVFEKET